MNWKWMEQAYQFDNEPSGGGGDEPPKPADGDDGAEGVTEPISSDDSGMLTHDMPDDPAPEPEPEPPPEPKPEPEKPPVETPDAITGMFRPPPAEGGPPGGPPAHYEPPPAKPEPKAPPPKVDPPTGDDWVNDPEAAAKKNAAYIEYQTYVATQPLLGEIDRLSSSFDGMQRGSFEQMKAQVERSVVEAEVAVTGLWGEKGYFNKDPEFRNNPEVQNHAKNIVQIAVDRALAHADRTGDTSKLEELKSERFKHRVLWMSKGEADIQSKTLVPGASPVGPQPPAKPQKARVSAEDSAALTAAKKDGRGYTEKQIADARKKISEGVV